MQHFKARNGPGDEANYDCVKGLLPFYPWKFTCQASDKILHVAQQMYTVIHVHVGHTSTIARAVMCPLCTKTELTHAMSDR